MRLCEVAVGFQKLLLILSISSTIESLLQDFYWNQIPIISMNSWQKNISICLIVLLAISSVASFFSTVTAETINPKYAGTKSIDSSLEIKFSKNNNSILYLDSDNNVDFSVGFGRYTFDYMSLGTFIYSVSYKTSWQNSPVQVYNWSFNDPANLKDDDPNPKQSSQGTISLKDAPLGKQQITVTALAGDYVTDFNNLLDIYRKHYINFKLHNRKPTSHNSKPHFQ